jgi:hypothetical protein
MHGSSLEFPRWGGLPGRWSIRVQPANRDQDQSEVEDPVDAWLIPGRNRHAAHVRAFPAAGEPGSRGDAEHAHPQARPAGIPGPHRERGVRAASSGARRPGRRRGTAGHVRRQDRWSPWELGLPFGWLAVLLRLDHFAGQPDQRGGRLTGRGRRAGQRRVRRFAAGTPRRKGSLAIRGRCRATGAVLLARRPAAGAGRSRWLRRGSDRIPRW